MIIVFGEIMASITHNIGKIVIEYDAKVESLSVVSNNAGQWTINIISENQQNENLVNDNDLKQLPIRTKSPSVDSIVDYITSKPNFEHDNADLQEHFLNRILESRGEDKNLYFSFAAKVNKAKQKIENKNDGRWESNETRELGKKRHVKVFIFKKEETNQSRLNYVQ